MRGVFAARARDCHYLEREIKEVKEVRVLKILELPFLAVIVTKQIYRHVLTIRIYLPENRISYLVQIHGLFDVKSSHFRVF